MTELLYQHDSYLRMFEAKVVSANGKHVFLDRTAFYPTSGGQINDTGSIRRKDGAEFNVINVTKTAEGICHEVDRDGLEAGDTVECEVDWERRHVLMRMHTAAHVLSAIVHRRTGALITGNQLGVDQSRFDFSLENFDREQMAEFCNEANALVAKNSVVKIYFLPRDEAVKIPGALKLADRLPPAIATLRIVEIEGVDIQIDGGTHVRSLGEIGTIEIVKMENKGAVNRRVYFSIKP